MRFCQLYVDVDLLFWYWNMLSISNIYILFNAYEIALKMPYFYMDIVQSALAFVLFIFLCHRSLSLLPANRKDIAYWDKVCMHPIVLIWIPIFDFFAFLSTHRCCCCCCCCSILHLQRDPETGNMHVSIIFFTMRLRVHLNKHENRWCFCFSHTHQMAIYVISHRIYERLANKYFDFCIHKKKKNTAKCMRKKKWSFQLCWNDDHRFERACSYYVCWPTPWLFPFLSLPLSLSLPLC